MYKIISSFFETQFDMEKNNIYLSTLQGSWRTKDNLSIEINGTNCKISDGVLSTEQQIIEQKDSFEIVLPLGIQWILKKDSKCFKWECVIKSVPWARSLEVIFFNDG